MKTFKQSYYFTIPENVEYTKLIEELETSMKGVIEKYSLKFKHSFTEVRCND